MGTVPLLILKPHDRRDHRVPWLGQGPAGGLCEVRAPDWGGVGREAAPLLSWWACPSPKKTVGPPREFGTVGAVDGQRITRKGNDTHLAGLPPQAESSELCRFCWRTHSLLTPELWSQSHTDVCESLWDKCASLLTQWALRSPSTPALSPSRLGPGIPPGALIICTTAKSSFTISSDLPQDRKGS